MVVELKFERTKYAVEVIMTMSFIQTANADTLYIY